MDDDDLEYFISFPTPKPYINSLNRKFTPEQSKKRYRNQLPSLLGDSPKKSSSSPDHTTISFNYTPSTTTLVTNTTEEHSINSSTNSIETSSLSQSQRNIALDHEAVSLGIASEDGLLPHTDNADDSDSESDYDEDDDDMLEQSGQTLPYFGGSGGREPVVLLLGWMGADDKHLAKYSALYTARGCICVRYTAPPSYLNLHQPNSFMMPLAQKLVAVLREMHLHTHPLFCHAFSNHGANLYYFVSKALDADAQQALKEHETPITVKGCVFDSCPAPRRVWSGVCAVYRVLQGPSVLRALVAMGAWLYLATWSLLGTLTTLVTGRLGNRVPWALVQEGRRVPQLFLYSVADSLISSADIEQFVMERRKLGVPVTSRRYQDSPHVQHFRWHPEDYSRTVFQFLTQCLTASSASDTEAPATASEPAASVSEPALCGSEPAVSGSGPAASGSEPAASGSDPAASGTSPVPPQSLDLVNPLTQLLPPPEQQLQSHPTAPAIEEEGTTKQPFENDSVTLTQQQQLRQQCELMQQQQDEIQQRLQQQLRGEKKVPQPAERF